MYKAVVSDRSGKIVAHDYRKGALDYAGNIDRNAEYQPGEGVYFWGYEKTIHPRNGNDPFKVIVPEREATREEFESSKSGY
ncbi:MAG: hypothetical protein NZ534_08505 [Bacteroidia bacterium]|nr:hypothetical protein [Bacteroidia bacterium]